MKKRGRKRGRKAKPTPRRAPIAHRALNSTISAHTWHGVRLGANKYTRGNISMFVELLLQRGLAAWEREMRRLAADEIRSDEKQASHILKNDVENGEESGGE